MEHRTAEKFFFYSKGPTIVMAAAAAPSASIRPTTPRRVGTAHTPRPVDMRNLAPAVDAASMGFSAMFPKYWSESYGPRGRPRSAAVYRGASPAVGDMVDGLFGCEPSDRNASHVRGGPIEFSRQSGRDSAVCFRTMPPPRTSTVSESSSSVTTKDAFDKAQPLVSPRSRCTVFRAAPPPRPSPVSTDAAADTSPIESTSTSTPPPPVVTSCHNRGKGVVSFNVMTSRRQAQYACGSGPPPTLLEYQDRLPRGGGPLGACRSAEEEKYYLEVFVDDEDTRFAVSTATGSRQRARIVLRKRNTLTDAPHVVISSVAEAKGVPSWRRPAFVATEASPRKSPPHQAKTAHAIDIPRPPSTAVNMQKSTGRNARVFSMLRVPQHGAVDGEAAEPLVAERDPRLKARHVRSVDFSKMRPHEGVSDEANL